MKVVESTYTVDNSVYYTKSYLSSNTGSFFRSIIKFIILLLVVLSIYRLVSGNTNTFTFSNFLSYLQNLPKLEMPSSIFESFLIENSWGFFDFLRIVINGFTGILSILAYIGVSLFQLLRFVTYTLGFLFV